MKELIEQLIQALQSAHAAVSELEQVEDKKIAASAVLLKLTTEISAAEEKLKSVTAGVTAKQLEGLRSAEDAIESKGIELRALIAKVEETKTALGEAEAEVKSKLAQHDQILASLDSLKKRLT